MKCKCGNPFFTVQTIPCCSDCGENPAYERNTESGSYWNSIYDEKEIREKNMEREGVETDGECRMGKAYGAGCYMFTCSKCHNKTNLAVSDSCG